MSIKGRLLSQIDVKNYNIHYDNKSYGLKLGVFGIFDTISINWDYYAVSFIDSNSGPRLCSDLSKIINTQNTFGMEIGNIRQYFRKYDTQQDAESFINEFKVKWETGSNNTKQEIREERLKEILGGGGN